MIKKDINLFDLQVENAINLQRNGEFEQARSIYEKLLNKGINKFKIFFLLGTLEAQCRNFSKAINYLLKASKLNPNSWEISYNLGNAYTEVNEFNNAIKFYNQAIKHNSVNLANAIANSKIAGVLSGSRFKDFSKSFTALSY